MSTVKKTVRFLTTNVLTGYRFYGLELGILPLTVKIACSSDRPCKCNLTTCVWTYDLIFTLLSCIDWIQDFSRDQLVKSNFSSLKINRKTPTESVEQI